jgi:hypothetical protein
VPRPRPNRTDIERRIGDLAEAYGWRHHHARCTGRTRDGYADGFPVDVLVRDNRLVFFTVAGAAELPAPEAAWATALAAIGSVEMHVIRGHDLPELTQLLRRSGPRVETRAPPAMPLVSGGADAHQ